MSLAVHSKVKGNESLHEGMHHFQKVTLGCLGGCEESRSHLLSFSLLHSLWQKLSFPLKSLLSIKAPSYFLKLYAHTTCRL